MSEDIKDEQQEEQVVDAGSDNQDDIDYKALYEETKAKLEGNDKQSDAQDPEKKPEELDYEDVSLENVQKIANSKGVDYSKIEEEYYSNGNKLSEDTVKDLAEKGISEDFIGKVTEGLQATAEQEKAKVATVCGGIEEYEATLQWAAGNLSEAELADIRADLVNKPSLTTTKAIVKFMYERRIEAEGKTPEYITGKGGGTPADVYKSSEEMMADMKNPKYKASSKEYDPAFVKQVADKIARSKANGKKIY